MVFANARWWVVAVAVFMLPPAAESQTASTARPGDAVIAGAFQIVRPGSRDTHGFRHDWYHAGEVSAGVGWRWTPHLKAELDVSMTGEGRQYVVSYVTAPSVPYPIPLSSERYTSTRAASAAVTWQFADNEWVQPFVQGGVAVDSDRVRIQTHAQRVYTGDPRAGVTAVVVGDEAAQRPFATTSVGALVGAGAKFYVSPRAFVRTDARLVVRPDATRLSLRAAVGFDF